MPGPYPEPPRKSEPEQPLRKKLEKKQGFSGRFTGRGREHPAVV